jgi:CheY-like chemotaxis protein
MLVDDNDDIRSLVRLMCEHAGFDVVGEAADGLEAIRVANTAHPDVVVLDYLMPNMRGDEAAGHIRAVAPGVSILAFTASLESEPEWGEAYLPKDRISDVVSVLEDLGPGAATPHSRLPWKV